MRTEKYFDGVCFSSYKQLSEGVLGKAFLKISPISPYNFIEKTAEQMFPCAFCGISKSTYFLEICERLLLSCYFSNLKIFCVHALELFLKGSY